MIANTFELNASFNVSIAVIDTSDGAGSAILAEQ